MEIYDKQITVDRNAVVVLQAMNANANFQIPVPPSCSGTLELNIGSVWLSRS